MPDDFIPPKTNQPVHVRVDQPKDPPAEVLKTEFKLDESVFKGEPGTNSIVAPVQLPPKEPNTNGTDANKGAGTTDKKGVDGAGKKETKPDKVEKIDDKEATTIKEDKSKLPSFLKAPTDEKKDDKGKEAQAKDETKGQVKVPTGKQKVVRNYAEFSQDEVAALKQMSDEAYAYTSNLIKQNKELTKSKSDLFLQHPTAYTLSPEYTQAQQDIYFHQTEAKVWEQALLACDDGKPFKEPKGFDANGNMIFGNEIQPTKLIEEKVRANLMECNRAAKDKIAQMQNVATNYKNQVNNVLSAIENERKSRFEWVKNPELMKYSLDINGEQKTLQQINDDFLSIYPAFLRPYKQEAADLMVALAIRDAELKEARMTQERTTIEKEELKRGEPTSDNRNVEEGKKINGVSRFSIEGMPD